MSVNYYNQIEIDFTSNVIFLELLKKKYHFSRNELFILNDIIKTFHCLKEIAKKMNY